jgi:hypothetical protein
MNRAEFLRELEAGHAELLAAIEGLSEAELTEPGVTGTWSVRDILAHITAWEADLHRSLSRLRAGQRPRPPDISDAEVDALNAEWHAQMAERRLDKVLEDWKGVRKQTLRRVGEVGEAELSERGYYPGLGGETLADYIKAETFEHDREHAGDIRGWRQRRAAHAA